MMRWSFIENRFKYAKRQNIAKQVRAQYKKLGRAREINIPSIILGQYQQL